MGDVVQLRKHVGGRRPGEVIKSKGDGSALGTWREFQHDINKETDFIRAAIEEDAAVFFCPSCGQLMGANNKMTCEWFECGLCGAKWYCENFDDLFNEAYPGRGK